MASATKWQCPENGNGTAAATLLEEIDPAVVNVAPGVCPTAPPGFSCLTVGERIIVDWTSEDRSTATFC